MNVPLLDLKAQFATLKDEMMPLIEEVLDSQYLVGGPMVAKIEEMIAEYSGCEAAVGVSSGTDALLATLMALDIGAGDEVITTPFTFFATAGAIWRTGAKPVFVDIEPDTFNIDPALIKAAITDKTRAIMPVHLFGQIAEMDAIMEIAGEAGLHVIEDAAQAIGAVYRGRKAGSIGTAGCLSFYPSKNLGGLGDGGMVVTRDKALADRVMECRNHGMAPRYYHKWVGGNFRLDALQSAGLIVKMGHLDNWSAKRRENAARYNELFADCDAVVTPVIRDYNESVINQYVIRVPRRDELQAFLKENGIGTDIYYPLCMHQQECFASLGYKLGDFPQAEKATTEVLAIPVFPELTGEQVEYVAAKIKEFLA